ncbi:MAG: hypothetical protein HYX94_05160 [Chloroflexi bacterium]|nr:hypothetical protein [Chloroflexota bacterium]
MSRVDDLQEKYPSLPRQYIVRWDTRVHGLSDSGKLDEIGRWVPINPEGGAYANFDFDITLKDWVEAKPGRQKPGYVLRPARFVLPENGIEINHRDMINSKSDLEVRAEGNGRFALYQGEERVEEVWHQPSPAIGEKLTSSGKPESDFLSRRSRHCFGVYPLRDCEYFQLGLACKFCNFNPTHEDARSVGMGHSTTGDIKQTVEAYKRFASEVRIVEGIFVIGGLRDSDKEVTLAANFAEKLAPETPYHPNFSLCTQPMNRKNMQRLKDVGVDCLICNMEVWDPELFAEIVPGKAQYRGRERYLEAFQEAVGVFGAGNVTTNFAGGVTLIPERGHKTWQEARDSTIEGIDWMVRHGVLPSVSWLRFSPGAAYASEENRKKVPPTDFYLEVALAHHEACKKHGLYDKLNRLMLCPLDVLTSLICGELGAYELAGSLAEWTAAVVPREANRFRQWEEQHMSPPANR